MVDSKVPSLCSIESDLSPSIDDENRSTSSRYQIDRIQFSNLTTISNETVENRENNCLLFLKVQLEFKWDLIVKYNGIVREIKMAESIN
jgi:hypothetical protein